MLSRTIWFVASGLRIHLESSFDICEMGAVFEQEQSRMDRCTPGAGIVAMKSSLKNCMQQAEPCPSFLPYSHNLLDLSLSVSLFEQHKFSLASASRFRTPEQVV